MTLCVINADMRPNVFNYNDPASYLRDSLAFKQTRNPSFSARAWSRQMGFKGHSLLVFFLNGKRPIKPRHLAGLCKGLDLVHNERRYFEALVHFASAESPDEKQVYESWLKDLHPSREFCFVDLEKFRLISDWVHMAILEMTQLAEFDRDPKWIEKRLGGKASVYQIEDAIVRMLALGLLKEEEGRLVKTNARLTTPKDRPSQAIREHHKQVMGLAALALDEQDVSVRDFNSCAMTIDSSKLDEAKKLIAAFRSKMAALMESPGGDATYQLSIQFFGLTPIRTAEPTARVSIKKELLQ